MPDKKIKVINSLDDVQPDPRNANRHTLRGMKHMEQSLRECGYGDSMTVDVNGVVISGNGRAEVLADLKMLNPIVVQSDGTRPIIHQRIDLDLETDTRAKHLAIAQNRVGQTNLEWDSSVLAELSDEGVDLSPWFFDNELALLTGEIEMPQDEKELAGNSLDVGTEKPAYRHLTIYFKTADDWAAFESLLDTQIADEKKSIWYEAHDASADTE